jgi:hypothetical protein
MAIKIGVMTEKKQKLSVEIENELSYDETIYY